MSGLNDILLQLHFWLWGLISLLTCILISTLAAWRWGLAPLIWRLARLLGWIGLLWRIGWVPPLVGLVAIFLSMEFLFSPMMEALLHLPRTWFNPWTILAVYTLIWLLIWAWQARQQLVVEEFKNYAGDDFNASAKGLAVLLVVRLSQLHELYRTVDEQRAIPTSALQSEAIDAAIDVESVGTVLKDAVSSQSTLSLGPLSIPVGTLMSLLGRLVQGPRIIGSLHKDKGMLIVTAQCTRERSSFKWRVDPPIPSQQASPPSPRSLSEMVEELACRIFTDLALNSSVRWRATSLFSEGLRAYRECLRTPKDRSANLREAESKFIETLTEDTKFSLAYYDLGVVHTELEHKKAAKTAFEQAITHDPTSWTAYYARALSCCESKEYYRSILLCKRVIELRPGWANQAKAYQLMASVQHRTSNRSDFLTAIKSCKKAIHLCYLALFWAEMARQDNDKVSKLRTLLVVCMTELARIYNHQADTFSDRSKTTKKLKKAERLLRSVSSFKSSDATYYALYLAELAETYSRQKKYAEATHQLRIATRITSDHIQYWATLAEAYANAVTHADKSRNREKFDPDYQEFIFGTILDFASDKPEKVFGDALKKTHKAYEQLASSKELAVPKEDFIGKCGRIKSIKSFLDLGTEVIEEAKGEKGIPLLEAKLKEHHGNVLNFAQVALALGRLYLRFSKGGQLGDNNPGKFDCLVKELSKHEKGFAAGSGKDMEWEHGQILCILASLYSEAGEVKRRVTGKLARDERKENLQLAKYYYQKAIEVLEKKHPREVRIQGIRSKLATTLLELDEYREALQIAQKAILFDALAYDNHDVLGDVYSERGDFEHAIEAWKEAILRRDAMALDSYGPELHVKIGRAYVRLAQLHGEMCVKEGKNQEAVNYMQQALKCCGSEHLEERLEIYYSLGYFYSALGEYEEALKYLRLARKFKFAPLTSRFYLAYAYLRNREYDASIKEFRLLQEDIAQEVHERPEKIVEQESIGHIPLGEMRALAYWGQAFVYAERDANLCGALELAEEALKQTEPVMKASSTRLQFPGRYPDCKGWILYKLGKTDEAIGYLEQSIAQEAQAETYLHLALAYESKLQQTTDKAQKQQLLTHIQAYCQHTLELDATERFVRPVEHLRQRQRLRF
jgi:tetratricopeptide (TPR) repeat protein